MITPAVKIIILSTIIITGVMIACMMITQIIQRRRRPASTWNEGVDLTIEDIDDQQLIRTLLQQSIDTREKLAIKLNDRGRAFTSSILDISTRELIVDALFPYEGNEFVQAAKFLSVGFTVAETVKTPYRFTSSFLGSITHAGYPALRISLPGLIKRDQKRNYHRVTPTANEDLTISFMLEGKHVTEKIANISGGGIGFFTNLGKQILWSGKTLEPATVSIPQAPEIPCIVVVYTAHQTDNPVIIDGKPCYYYCGAEFRNLEDTEREKIIQYVVEKERDELKRINRQFA